MATSKIFVRVLENKETCTDIETRQAHNHVTCDCEILQKLISSSPHSFGWHCNDIGSSVDHGHALAFPTDVELMELGVRVVLRMMVTPRHSLW